MTYTSNYNLKKPGGSDTAEINDLNGNADILDEVIGNLTACVTAEYDTTETYAIGSYCLHNGNFYRAQFSTSGTWDASDWVKTTLADELGKVRDFDTDQVMEFAVDVNDNLVIKKGNHTYKVMMTEVQNV